MAVGAGAGVGVGMGGGAGVGGAELPGELTPPAPYAARLARAAAQTDNCSIFPTFCLSRLRMPYGYNIAENFIDKVNDNIYLKRILSIFFNRNIKYIQTT